MHKFRSLFDLWMKISVLVFFFSGIYIAVFFGTDTRIPLSYIFSVFATSALCALGTLILPDAKLHLSRKENNLRILLHFLYLNLVIFGCGYFLGWYDIHNIAMVLTMELIIIAVYISVLLLNYQNDARTADELNQKLKH
jgi:hypothetical protein